MIWSWSEGDTRVWSKEVILGPTVTLLKIRGVLEGLLEIGRYGWKGVFKAYILHAKIKRFRAFTKEFCGVEQETNISYYCKYTTFCCSRFLPYFWLGGEFLAKIFQKGAFICWQATSQISWSLELWFKSYEEFCTRVLKSEGLKELLAFWRYLKIGEEFAVEIWCGSY